MVSGDVMSASPANRVPTRRERREQARAPEPLGYRPALDGLRAVAAGSVLLYHGGVGWASGGFLGVDVFFVLSGFLITALLLTEWERTGSIAILAFYGRRLRRLLPALLLVIAAVAMYAVILAPSSQLRELRGDLFATFGYVTNWRLVVSHRGYFDAFAAPSPLKHTWSLAVEEQWYLIWPIAIFGLLHLTRRRHRHRDLRSAVAIVAVLCAASTIWMAVLYRPGTDPSRVYYGTDTRAQELLAGALLAFVCVMAGRYSLRSPWRAVVGVVGTAAFVWAFVLFASVDDRTTWLYQGGMLVFSFAVVAVIVAAIQPQGLLPSVLSLRPLRWIGMISYGLYLWHWPIYVACTSDRTGLDGTPLLLLRLALTVGAATASYYLVERPIRHLTFRPLALAVAFPATVVGTVVVVLLATSGAPPTSANALDAAQKAKATPSTLPDGSSPDRLLQNPATRRVVVTGDSVALTLSFGYPQGSGSPPVYVLDKSVLGCSLFPGTREIDGQAGDGGPQCAPWRAERDTWLRDFHPDVVVVLSSIWELYDRTVDGTTLPFGSPESDAWFSQHLDALIAQLHSTGARVAFLTVPCNDRVEPVNGAEPRENVAADVDHLNDLYRQAVRRHPDAASLIDLHDHVCPGDQYSASFHGITLRNDGVHFSLDGSREVWKWLRPKVDALVSR